MPEDAERLNGEWRELYDLLRYDYRDLKKEIIALRDGLTQTAKETALIRQAGFERIAKAEETISWHTWLIRGVWGASMASIMALIVTHFF